MADSIDVDRSLYVTPAEVVQLLAREPGLSVLRPEDAPREPLVRPGDGSRLAALATAFALEPIDLNIVLLALAPEIDRRYGRVYSFLQDDATRQRPSIDLALELFCGTLDDKLATRRRLDPCSPLVRHRLIWIAPDDGDPEPSGLRATIRIASRVVRHLLGGDDPDPRLAPSLRRHDGEVELDDLKVPIEARRNLEQAGRRLGLGPPSPILYLHGPDPEGKLAAAAAVARRLGLAILAVDGERLLIDEGSGFEEAVALVLREAALGEYVLYWEGLDASSAPVTAGGRGRVSGKPCPADEVRRFSPAANLGNRPKGRRASKSSLSRSRHPAAPTDAACGKTHSRERSRPWNRA